MFNKLKSIFKRKIKTEAGIDANLSIDDMKAQISLYKKQLRTALSKNELIDMIIRLQIENANLKAGNK